MAASFPEYVQTWSECTKLRERLECYSAGRFRLLPHKRLVILEINGMTVSLCPARKDAARDVVICFSRWAQNGAES